MQIHVLFRTHLGGNTKARPSWYRRELGIASLVSSLQHCTEPWSLTVVADGGIPDEIATRLPADHRQVVIRAGATAASFRGALRVARGMANGDGPDTSYFLVEDDYLFAPEAVSTLARCLARCPAGTYVAPYAPDDSQWHADHPSQPEHVPAPRPEGPLMVGGAAFDRVGHTTSTFATSKETLVQDFWLHDLGSRAGAPFDSATWHALQGVAPYPGRHLLSDLAPSRSARGMAKVLGKPVMRSVVDVASRRRAARPRQLLAPDRNLALHLEAAFVTAERDWEQLATSVLAGE